MDTWQRPKPRLVHLRDCSVLWIFLLMYTTAIPSYVYIFYLRDYGIRIEDQLVAYNASLKTFNATIKLNSTRADYIGISLANDFAEFLSNISSQKFDSNSSRWKATASFSERVEIGLEIEGAGCKSDQMQPDKSDPYTKDGNDCKTCIYMKDFKLVGAWLVLSRPASCESYDIKIRHRGDPATPPPSLNLVVQTPQETYDLIGFWIRAVISSVFLILTLFLMLGGHLWKPVTILLMWQWTWVYMTKGRTNLPVGLWSVFIMNASIVFQCNPLELFTDRLGAYVLPSLGKYMYLWAKLQFLRELLYDLKRFPSELDKPEFLDVGLSASLILSSAATSSRQSSSVWTDQPELSCCAKRWNFCLKILARAYAHSSALFDILEFTFLVICASVCVWRAEEVEEDKNWNLALLGNVNVGDETFEDKVYLLGVVGHTLFGLFFVWIPLRILTVASTLKAHAYSHCRVHFIVFSFFLLSNIINLLNAVPIAAYEYLRTRNPTSTLTNAGLWYSVDKMTNGILLPNSSTNLDLQYVIIHAMTAFLFTVVFGITSCVDECFSRLGAMSQSSNEIPDLLSNSQTDKANLKMVRILAHCANLVYCDDLDKRIQMLKDSSEHELDFSTLELVAVEVDDENDTKVAILRFQDGDSKLGVVVFRGTHSWKNVFNDLKFSKTELPWQRSGEQKPLVHSGFLTALSKVRVSVLNEVEKLLDECDMIWCCGHSLGGALATLMVSCFRDSELKRIGLCTFGSPRVGDSSFVKMISRACMSIRVVCEADPFTSMPNFGSIARVISMYLDVHGKCSRPYTHVPNKVRIFFNGHLIARPSLLEEVLRFFIHRTCFIQTLNVQRLRHHLMTSYLECLQKASEMEKNVQRNFETHIRRTQPRNSLFASWAVSPPQRRATIDDLELTSDAGSFRPNRVPAPLNNVG